MKKYLFALLICMIGLGAWAQNDSLKIGQWRSYLPYQKVRYVTQSATEIIIASPFAIMTIDKKDNSITYLSKVEELSDAGVQLVKYNKQSEVLLIAYSNSNIDLMDKKGNITNLRDILDNINIVGDKTIYDVYIKDGQFAYLACGFGVLKLNMLKGEFVSTTFTNSKTFGVTVWENELYAATENGHFSISENNPAINISNFNIWKPLGKKFGFADNYRGRIVQSYQDKLYIDCNDSLFVWDKNQTEKIYTPNGRSYFSFANNDGKNLLLGLWKIQADNGQYGGSVLYIDENGTLNTVANPDNCIVNCYYALEDESGKIWLADIEQGVKVMSSVNGTCRNIPTNSPLTNSVQQLEVESNKIWATAGGYTTNNSYNYNPEGFYFNIDGQWGYRNRVNDKTMREGYPLTIHSVTAIATNEATGKRFVGSFWGGVMEVDDKGNIIKHYTSQNSSLQTAIGDPNSTRVGGLAFDKKGTLWVSNNATAKPISALTTDGKWHAMGSAFNNAQIYRVAIDPNTGYKWFSVGKGNASIIVYDEGKDIASEADDRYIVLNSGNTRMPGSIVNWVEPDLRGEMWVATDDGVVQFSCGSAIFNKATNANVCNGTLPTTVVDGIPESLLKYNNVTTIAVDGANRKWFGTSNGIFVQSANGKDQVAFFDRTNSPLFDNNIRDIAIRKKTGEVFIATDKGIQSFKTDATEGQATNSKIITYPNPVRPDYDGPIAIKGLADGANVKITDVNGRLIFETEAFGGQAIWDGRDGNNNPVEKGVYLIFSTYTKDLDYPDEAVGKLLLMK